MGYGSSPKPDPQIGAAALQNAEIARQQFELGKDQLMFEREQWAKLEPLYTKMMEEAAAASSADRERSNEAWTFYNETFKPIEKRMASEAMSYDSPAEVARREGLAAATVQGQIENQRQQTTQELGRMGVSAARAGQELTTQSNDLALAKAGAVNKERNDTKLLGMQLRQDAANFGRGQTQIGLATGAAALQGAGAAQGTAQGGQNFRAGGAQMFNSAASGAVNANNSAASILNQQYQNQVAAYSGKLGAAGSLLGTGIGTAAAFMSTKKAKKDIKPIDDEASLAAVKATPVKSWQYKDGEGDGGAHVGPIAEDVQKNFGDGVAPGGEQIDVISMVGQNMAATRALAKKVEALELGLSAAPAKKKAAKLDNLSIIGLEAA